MGEATMMGTSQGCRSGRGIPPAPGAQQGHAAPTTEAAAFKLSLNAFPMGKGAWELLGAVSLAPRDRATSASMGSRKTTSHTQQHPWGKENTRCSLPVPSCPELMERDVRVQRQRDQGKKGPKFRRAKPDRGGFSIPCSGCPPGAGRDSPSSEGTGWP